jgi:glycosyltransferase involved in cell wall biosynthesis
MSWLFPAEKEAHKKGLIDLFLYQTKHTQEKVGADLKKINKNYNSKVFSSWFDSSKFPFHANRLNDRFRFGRISREDGDKYAKDTLWIYETMVAPGMKDGIILGFDDRSEKKIGKPPNWIRAYPGNGITQQEFYAHCACIIQKADTYENWPRMGMEAMASGSVLIVDNRGGWCEMVKHGVTGWLCNDSKEFVYYASRMAYEPHERAAIAQNARDYLSQIVGEEKSMQSWREVLCA